MSRPKLSYPPALRYRDFRLFWSGLFVSVIGSQMQLIAINWHIFNLLRGQTYTAEILGRSIELSAQALGLGTLGLVRVIPIILFALFGGMLADTRNRRTLLLFTEGFDVVIAAILAYLTLTGQATVLHIYIITAMLAAMNALEGPSRQSLVPHLVPAEHFANAISVQTLMMTVAAVIALRWPGW